jgi:dsRNA-specific ribonuclease
MIKKDLEKFESTIGVTFKNTKMLEKAFVHRSYINENGKSGLEHNERLEFLGDAVLELSATDYLFHKFKNKTEGELTAHRAALVNAVTLSEVALALIETGESYPEAVNADRRTALIYACKNSLTDVALALIATGKSNPDAVDTCKRTALVFAQQNMTEADVIKVLKALKALEIPAPASTVDEEERINAEVERRGAKDPPPSLPPS